MKNAAEEALDAIATLCGCSHWEYPGQVVRDVEALANGQYWNGNPNFVNCDGLPDTPHDPIGMKKGKPCPLCTSIVRAKELESDVYCLKLQELPVGWTALPTADLDTLRRKAGSGHISASDLEEHLCSRNDSDPETIQGELLRHGL